MATEVVSAKLFDSAGKEKGVVPLAAELFSGLIREELLHGAVRWQRAKSRAGTHSVLTRGEMKGGGKKPFKQKGTGRARAGSIISPLWVGGAVVHGPTPRSYEFRMSKKMRRGALISALSLKSANSAFFVIEGIDGATGKTRDASVLLHALGVAGSKVMVIVPNEVTDARELFIRALRNIPRVTIVPVSGVNVYDLMDCESVVCVRTALSELESRVQGIAA